MRTLCEIVNFSEGYFLQTPSTRRAVAAALEGRSDLQRDFSEIQLGRALAVLTTWAHLDSCAEYRGEIADAVVRLDASRKRATRRPQTQTPGPPVPPTEGRE